MGGNASRVPVAHQAEASPEFMAQVLGIKRVMPANPTGSQPVKKRKVVVPSQVDNEDDDDDDEVAAAAAQAALAGKNSLKFAVRGGICPLVPLGIITSLHAHFKMIVIC
jgi:hypothetical protein